MIHSDEIYFGVVGCEWDARFFSSPSGLTVVLCDGVVCETARFSRDWGRVD